jgi:cell division protein FtsZ
MMGTDEARDEGLANPDAEAAITNPLLDDASVAGAKGLLISVSGARRPNRRRAL